MGAFLSFLVFGMTAVFLYSKVMVLFKQTDVTIMMNLMEGSLTFDDTFTAEDGFFLAAALTAYDGETEIIEDEKYGELIIEHYGWGYSDGIGSGSRKIEHHYCSDEELGLEKGPNTHIYEIFEGSLGEV